MPSADEKCGEAFMIEPLATGLTYNVKRQVGPAGGDAAGRGLIIPPIKDRIHGHKRMT